MRELTVIGKELTTNVFALAYENVMMKGLIHDLLERIDLIERKATASPGKLSLDSTGGSTMTRDDLSGAAEDELKANEHATLERLKRIDDQNEEKEGEKSKRKTAHPQSGLRKRLTEGMDPTAAGPP